MGAGRGGAGPVEAGPGSLSRLAVRVGAAVVTLVLLTAACGGGSGTTRAAVGKTAPGFSTFDLDGKAVDLARFRGHPVLVNFWASWCVPCRAEFPVLRRAIENHPGLVVLGVVFQDSRGAAATFLRDQHATWPGLQDPKGQIAKAYGVASKPGIPVTVAVGADGVVRSRHLGPLQRDADVDALVTAGSSG